MEAIASYFKFGERGTDWWKEARGGLTTFMVMAYIVAVNPAILSAAGIDKGAAAAATALIAGVMTIAMGLFTNYPFAMAAGLGINALVAFTLVGIYGLSAAGAMGVIVWEGIVVTVLVIAGFREAVMNAVPLELKRAIGAGIGLFILFIGFANGGLIVSGCAPDSTTLGFCDGTLVTLAFPTTMAQYVFLFGLALTLILWVRRVQAALVISIIVTTIVALLVGVAAVPPEGISATPSFATLFHFDLAEPFSKLSILPAVIIIFAIMLTDFFDTMGTVTGVAAEAGLAEEDGSVPRIGRVLLVDSIGAWVGGLAGISSNTTYIESAAGVAEGAKTGFASIVTGVLFLILIVLSPLAVVVPNAATAPALVLVGYLMFTQLRGIDLTNMEAGIPVLLTLVLMPLTYDISVGIGAGFISWILIKVVRGKMSEVHPLVWIVGAGFVIFFAKDWLLPLVGLSGS